MCDDLLAHHHRLAASSFIPLSASPTWFTTQSNLDRNLNRTYLFLSPAYAIPHDCLTNKKIAQSTSPTPAKHAASTTDTILFPHFPAFFDINPRWTVYSFDKSVLALHPKADRTEMLYELVRPGHTLLPPTAALTPQDRALMQSYDLIEDTAWFKKTNPHRAPLLTQEKCLSIIDLHTGSDEPKRAGYLLLLPASAVPGSDGGDTRLYVSELGIAPEYHGRGAQHFSLGRGLVKMLLSAVIDVSGDIGAAYGASGVDIWTNISAEMDAEVLRVWLEMGWEVNRVMWLVERNTPEKGAEPGLEGGGGEEMKTGLAGFGPGESKDVARRDGAEAAGHHDHKGWNFSEWGKGMKGWRERWVKALDDISHGRG